MTRKILFADDKQHPQGLKRVVHRMLTDHLDDWIELALESSDR